MNAAGDDNSDSEETKSDDDDDSAYGSSSDDDDDRPVQLKEGTHKTSSHNLSYYMASLEMVMSSTPQVVQKVQNVMIRFMKELCPEIDISSDWENDIMAISTLKVSMHVVPLRSR